MSIRLFPEKHFPGHVRVYNEDDVRTLAAALDDLHKVVAG